MFGPKAKRALGALAFDALTISRGEQIRKRPLAQPHHRECSHCGFDRWDGISEHRWGGGRFAQRLCFGPPKTPTEAAIAAPADPLVDELRALALDPGQEIQPEPLEAPAIDTRHGFTVLGDARDSD